MGGSYIINEQTFIKNIFLARAFKNYKQLVFAFDNNKFYNIFNLSILKEGF